MYTIKVRIINFGNVSLNDDIRRFTVNALPTFDNAKTMLEQLFGVVINGSYDIKYLDPENDQITITNDVDLKAANDFAITTAQGRLIRLYLVPKGTRPSLERSIYEPAPAAPAQPSKPENAGNPLTMLLDILTASQQSQAQGPRGHRKCPYADSGNDKVHFRYICDGCTASPIVGDLHQCDSCPDFHLCDKCRQAGTHGHHTFTINPPNLWKMRGPHHRKGHGRWSGCNNSAEGTCNSASPCNNPATTSSPAVAAPVPVAASPVATPVKPSVPLVSVPVHHVSKTPTIVETTQKSSTPKPTVVPVPVAVPKPEELKAVFITDVTFPDGSEVAAGTVFNKVWRISNNGSSSWPLGCKLSLVHNVGERLSSVETIDIPDVVPAGSAVTISVEMEAPQKLGRHTSYWRMHGPNNIPFGDKIWADIVSVAPAPSAPAVEDKPIVTEPVAVPKAEKYPDAMEKLFHMGFSNIDLNRNLLDAHKGNLNAVVEQLLNMH